MNIPERGRSSAGNKNKNKNHEAHASSIEEFVKKFGGTKTINKVLIANNGIAAVKCMRSIRRWAYEVFRNDRAIKFVVMVSVHDFLVHPQSRRFLPFCQLATLFFLYFNRLHMYHCLLLAIFFLTSLSLPLSSFFTRVLSMLQLTLFYPVNAGYT